MAALPPPQTQEMPARFIAWFCHSAHVDDNFWHSPSSKSHQTQLAPVLLLSQLSCSTVNSSAAFIIITNSISQMPALDIQQKKNLFLALFPRLQSPKIFPFWASANHSVEGNTSLVNVSGTPKP